MNQLTLIASLAMLAAASVMTHFLKQGAIGFALAPIPLLFYRMDSFRFMLLSLSCYLLFFEAYKPGSNFLFFNTPDSLIIVYLALVLFWSKRFFSFAVPVSAGLIPLYAFVIYGLALSIHPFFKYGFDFYVLRDIKNLLFLLLVPLLCRTGDPLFAPKNVFRILLAFVVFSSAHAVVLIVEFISTGIRVVSWNEVFLADSVLMAAVLLSVGTGRRTRILLFTCLTVSIIGVLATQTRGLWLSSLMSIAIYAVIRMINAKSFQMGSLFRGAQIALGMLILGEVIFRISSGVGVLDFIQNRMMSNQANELVNPYSSLGYRIHESLVVWEQRTWFGHGSGGRLYMFFTQLGMSKFINWWSIHSEYFEILHKYGFVGLGLFLWFLFSLIRRAYRIAVHGNRFASAMGYVVLVTILNHSLVSITSGYLLRENVMLYMVLMVGIVERYYPRVFPARISVHPGGGGPPGSA